MEYGTNKNREVPDHHPGGPDLAIYSKVAPLRYRVGEGATGNMASEKSHSEKSLHSLQTVDCTEPPPNQTRDHYESLRRNFVTGS
jgi:hypothetical protein